MCGICGIVSNQPVEVSQVKNMAQAIAHRGPDDEGYYVNGRVGIGSRRLSIIDLAGGRMPISNESGTVWIVSNGEIYNYSSLRKELVEKGHTFQTETDTEVIVHLYEEYSVECVQFLRGMFAFAIWDEAQQILFLARDRLGQKPLYYAHVNGQFLFGSEIKALLTHPAVTREINLESLHHYLTLRFIPSPCTMFRDVSKLPPAHTLVYQSGRVNVQRYWDVSFHDKLCLSEDTFLEGLRDKLNETVGAHMISDVPVGAFLSGGMDSSMVVALMAGHLKDPFQTFAVGVKEQGFNELPYAREVADRYSTIHTEACVESDLMRLLPRIIWHMDEPGDPISACMFHAAQLASRKVKVVLGGDGGDELFAGFDRYYGVGRLEAYARLPSIFRKGIIGPVINFWPENYAYKSVSQKMRWVNTLSFLPDDATRYAGATAIFRFAHADKQALYSDDLWKQVGHLDSMNVITDVYRSANADHILDRMLYTDMMTRLPEHSLMLTDKMTMAHSLEARSPLLDHELVEYLALFPAELKINGKELKYIFRRLGEDYLPKEIVSRDKQGFMFPIAYWFQNELHPFLETHLLNSHFVKEGIFRADEVKKLLSDHVNNRIDNHVKLWMLLNLDIWNSLYIDGEDVGTVVDRLNTYLPQNAPV